MRWMCHRCCPELVDGAGQGEAARQAYSSSLEIRERLAKSEPERADYQLDLVVSLVKVATAGDSPARPPLERALALLLELDRQGRLAPADQPKIEALRQMLVSAPPPPQPPQNNPAALTPPPQTSLP